MGLKDTGARHRAAPVFHGAAGLLKPFVNAGLVDCTQEQIRGFGGIVAQVMHRLVWVPILAVVVAVFWLAWLDGQRQPSDHLFSMPDAASEAGYCLAVAERGRELTGGQADGQLEQFLTENIDFWRARVGDAAVTGRAALGHDVAQPGVQEQALLHLALQDCGQRAVGLYGHRFASMPGG